MDSTAKTAAHCEDCLPIPDAFPIQCGTHLYDDARLIFSGQTVADKQCTYMCALTVAAWAGRFVPTNGLGISDGVGEMSNTAKLDALKSVIEVKGLGADEKGAFDWKSILRLALDVILKLLV